MMRYLLNGFLLVAPLLAMNVALARFLPTDYKPPRWNQVPAPVTVAEHLLRIPTMLLPVLLPIGMSRPIERVGVVLYVLGVMAYVAAWAAQVLRPHGAWSSSTAGFLAPAYTPGLWLLGIGLIGTHPTIARLQQLPWAFLTLAAAFTAVHVLHAGLIPRSTSDPVTAPAGTGRVP